MEPAVSIRSIPRTRGQDAGANEYELGIRERQTFIDKSALDRAGGLQMDLDRRVVLRVLSLDQREATSWRSFCSKMRIKRWLVNSLGAC